MNDMPMMLLAGTVLGAMFFGGLWWTVRRGVTGAQPALWFAGSLLLRTTIVMAGFYYVSAQQWQRLLWCLVGFVLARLVVMQVTRVSPTDHGGSTRESSHAP
jgi:F1F0 ATPase subunit 2